MMMTVEERKQRRRYQRAELIEAVDPEAKAFLVRNRAQILRRYVELSCAHHAGRLMAEREASAARAVLPAGRVH